MHLQHSVLVGHFLTSGDDDGGAFICTDQGAARNFYTIEDATREAKELNKRVNAPVWSVFMLTEVPVSEPFER